MVEKRTFEKSMGELEGVVKGLESGDLTLDDCIKAFEKGMKLTKECDAMLTDAKGRVEKLIKGAGGNVAVEPFQPKE
jgi:exodeoxyribonuclease VII small subunit